MSEKMFNTRIQHKHDVEANWLKAINFTPKAGELIVYDPDENFNYARTKIGDGLRSVNDLPFVQVQSDWNQNDENAPDFVKNKPVKMTKDDALNLLLELNDIKPIINENGTVFTNESGAIFVI